MPEHESASSVYSGVLHDTPAGAVAVWVTRNGVRRIGAVTPEMIADGNWDGDGHPTLRVALHQLDQYFTRRRKRFHLPLDFSGATEFQRRIFERLIDIPYGRIVSYGDIAYEPRVLSALVESAHEVSVVVDRNWRAYWEHRFADPLEDAESLAMNGAGCITDIGSPVSDIGTIEAQYIGLMRFRGAGVEALKAARAHLATVSRPWMEKRTLANAYMTDVLMEMIQMGCAVRAVPVDGGWLEIDTVEDYETAAAMIADGTITRFFDPAAGPGGEPALPRQRISEV